MAYRYSYIPVEETVHFSKLVSDYVTHSNNIKPFYKYAPGIDGIGQAIADRVNYPVDRYALTSVLNRQYEQLEKHARVAHNLQLLEEDNTFTVCTAHQPNLLTGYLYFVYKILHAIKLADELNTQHPGKNFVPVYYMGSEDNDIEELGVFRFRGEKYIWDGDGQKGAVGRMNTSGLNTMLNDLFRLFGPPGKDADRLQKIITQAYLKHKTIGAATQYLVNELFGRYGLIVLDPDDAALKSRFIPVMEDELLHQHAYPILAGQIGRLSEHYKIQAHPREINLFYLTDQLRERIEKHGDTWKVVNTGIEWNRQQLLEELHSYPEHFSPNVMLRGLFQEMILPDVVFIGGGAEVAYWMQLKTLFEHYKGFFPYISLRQSVMLMNEQQEQLQNSLNLTLEELFTDEEELVKQYVSRHAGSEWQTTAEVDAISAIMQQLKTKAVAVDKTLGPSAEAVLKKIEYRLHTLEQKMFRAEKRRQQVQLDRLSRLKAGLFPNGGLQERVDNFMEYYMEQGETWFDALLEGIKPIQSDLLVLHMSK